MIRLILSAQTYGRANAQDITYSIIKGNMVVEPTLINKGTPWNTANDLHYEFRDVNPDEKIAITDAIYDGYEEDYTISKQEIIQSAWDLIDHHGIPQDAFVYMRGKTR